MSTIPSTIPSTGPSTAAGTGEDRGFTLGGRRFTSRLIVGTGKYRSDDEMRESIAASVAELVTVALRRVERTGQPSLLEVLDTKRYALLPNTAGCYTVEDALRTARLARELCATELVKLE